ncbi:MULTISPECIES: phage baseplate assembly protein V [Microbulbifer]|uniref:phage baseplate assembly protein V n=1 Tax=Microbulbifer TaxID=48073 RepID=UPI001E55BC53|nr:MULTISPECIES: phage baseplate assembly protein V [Microbulbifer]UHQ55356.1 phage baseplate assembly protein V [Microbulbifer sp. YPW16]
MSDIPNRGPTIDELYRPSTGRLYGKYLGEIIDRDDPKCRGRLRIRVDNITDSKGVWADPCVPYAGDGIGFFALPPEGTRVWVEFLGGRIDRLVYCGFLWQEGELDAQDYDPARVHFETGSLRIEVDDSADEIKIEIKKNGGSITIKGGEITLKANVVTQEAQGNKVVLDAAAFDVKNAALKVV